MSKDESFVNDFRRTARESIELISFDNRNRSVVDSPSEDIKLEFDGSILDTLSSPVLKGVGPVTDSLSIHAASSDSCQPGGGHSIHAWKYLTICGLSSFAKA